MTNFERITASPEVHHEVPFENTLAFREGYFKGLLDVQNWIEQHQQCLKEFHINSAKGIIAFLKCAIQNLDYFMESGDQAVFKVTKNKKRILFEWDKC